MVKELQGVYNNIDEAVAKVQSLNDRGYDQKDITILANRDVESELPWNVDAQVSTTEAGATETEDKGLWDSIKSAFVVDDVENQEGANSEFASVRETHRANLDAGKVLVFVDTDADVYEADYNKHENYAHHPNETVDAHDDYVHKSGTATGAAAAAQDPAARADVHADQTATENIQLKEERVNVDKEEHQTGEVTVGKRVVEETQTVEVPVKREEVTIKRKPVSDQTVAGGINDVEEEEIVIPTKEERVHVSKDTAVVEEVEISKEVHEDTETVEETVRHEELDVDGDVHGNDTPPTV